MLSSRPNPHPEICDWYIILSAHQVHRMLSKFKKLFRLSRPAPPQKEKEPDTVLQPSTSTGDLSKKKDKGKRKNSHPSDVGDGVDTQNPSPLGEIEIVENEFIEDEHYEGESEYPQASFIQ